MYHIDIYYSSLYRECSVHYSRNQMWYPYDEDSVVHDGSSLLRIQIVRGFHPRELSYSMNQ
jgi:hypothetical protein